MAVRSLWHSRCSTGHVYSGFRGRPGNCPECGGAPETWLTCPHETEGGECECMDRIQTTDELGDLDRADELSERSRRQAGSATPRQRPSRVPQAAPLRRVVWKARLGRWVEITGYVVALVAAWFSLDEILSVHPSLFWVAVGVLLIRWSHKLQATS